MKPVRIDTRSDLSIFRYGEGTGEIFVSIHGWSGDHRVFEPLLPWLPEDATLYSIDLPGSGASAPPESWTMKGVTQPIVDALRELAPDGVTLIGNCAGAVICMEAVSLGAPVRRLVMIDPFAFAPWYFALLSNAWLGRFFYYLTFANPLGRIIGNVILMAKRKAATDMFRGFASVRHNSAWRFLRLLCTEPQFDRYAQIAVPVDVVHGERTFAAVRDSVAMFCEAWGARCRVFTAAGAGHLPIQEASDVVASVGFRRLT